MTRETFAVGTHLGGNGVFGMKLREDELHEIDPTRIGPVKYWLGEKEYRRRIEASMIDTSFRARKSVFRFDDRIVCLGSGIRSADPRHRAVTTLLQHHLPAERRNRFQVSVCAYQEGMFPVAMRIDDGEPFWLIDSVGNGYYLPDGHDPAQKRRRTAESALPSDDPTRVTNCRPAQHAPGGNRGTCRLATLSPPS